MPTFERSIVVRAPREWLFDLMQDYDRRLEWDAFLSDARLLDGERSAVGVTARCTDTAGRAMDTVYVSLHRPERVAVKMTRGPWMFAAFAGAWIYHEVTPAETRVTFRYHVESRVDPFGAGDRLLAWIFERQMGSRLESLRERMEAIYERESRATSEEAG